MEHLNEETKAMLNKWLVMHGGNVEELARWMRRHLRFSITDARALILEAQA